MVERGSKRKEEEARGSKRKQEEARGSKRKQEDFWLEAELRFPLASSCFLLGLSLLIAHCSLLTDRRVLASSLSRGMSSLLGHTRVRKIFFLEKAILLRRLPHAGSPQECLFRLFQRVLFPPLYYNRFRANGAALEIRRAQEETEEVE